VKKAATAVGAPAPANTYSSRGAFCQNLIAQIAQYAKERKISRGTQRACHATDHLESAPVLNVTILRWREDLIRGRRDNATF
jgi:hypothetical protein